MSGRWAGRRWPEMARASVTLAAMVLTALALPAFTAPTFTTAAFAAPAPATRQPYVPDVTEAREKQWRTLTSQAQNAYAAGQMAQGAAHAREALTVAEEIFDEDDPRTLISVNDLALNLDALHQDEEAETLLRRAFDAYLRSRGEADQNTQLAAENLIDFYASRNRHAAALLLAGWALDSRRRTMGTSSTQSQRMEERLQQLAAAAPPSAPPPPAEVATEAPTAVPARLPPPIDAETPAPTIMPVEVPTLLEPEPMVQ